MISEIKIDESFPETQFLIESYTKPFRRDRDTQGGGLLIYARDEIPCKVIKLQNQPADIECVFIEIYATQSGFITLKIQASLIF